MSLFPACPDAAARLRRRVARGGLLVAPGCFDAFSARLIEKAGFEAAFLGGFGVSASRLGLPDAGLLSYGEMLDQGRNVCAAVGIPVIGDADTGHGNAVNAQRSLLGFAAAGFGCVMLEDQVWPKRCGHTPGKQTVDRPEALARVRAACAIRQEMGVDVLILARTDAAQTDGLDEALWRAEAFAEAGADWTFVEALQSEDEMRRYCASVPGPKVANVVEGGSSPLLPPSTLEEIGYAIAIYPLSLLLSAQASMERALDALRAGTSPVDRVSFEALQRSVDFPEYRERAAGFGDDPESA